MVFKAKQGKIRELFGFQIANNRTFWPIWPEYAIWFHQAELEIRITGEGNVVKKLTINGKEANKIPTTATGKQVVRIEMGNLRRNEEKWRFDFWSFGLLIMKYIHTYKNEYT